MMDKEFSRIHGAPFLKRDVIELEKGKVYHFRVTFLEASHPSEIYPCFAAPDSIGWITTDSELTDLRGKKSIGKPVKMLATGINLDHRDFYFSYSSDCGFLSVYFFCRYYDKKMHLDTGGFSSNAEGLYMLREDDGLNRVLYRCNAPGTDAFDSLVFSVEWKVAEQSSVL